MIESTKDSIFKKSVNVNRMSIIRRIKKIDCIVGKNFKQDSKGEYVEYIRLSDVLEMLGDKE